SKTVNSYVARTGKKPVVIIDYLQILKPTNDRGTDKANVTTSVNEMKKIATRYHIPVIVISSFNRLNYNSPVSMEAFKESGD
ncbi:helicase DnaB, partial [Streptococcus thermophilus]|nr:helicase DnaB [Streptococcus thermophilus]